MLFFLFSMCLKTQIGCANEEMFYSQYSQDKYVYETFFKDKRSGVFVDVGAHDGVTLSNTYFFEKYMGWSGVCVEPIPEVFDKLKSNRACKCIQGCIFDKKETVAFLKVSGYAEMLSGIVENYDSEHISRIEEENNQHGGKSEVIEVQCFNLTKLLLDNGVSHIDYLSIDTEGGEMGILQSIDFKNLEIDVISVENNYQLPFNDFLKQHGYSKMATLGCDEIYKKG